MSIGRVPGVTGIQPSIVDAKGDLIVATAADSVSRLAVGSNNQRLVADSAEATGLKYVADTQNTVVDAKGDLLVGSAADTLGRLAVGTNGHTLVADSAETLGVKWAAPAGGGANWSLLNSGGTTLTGAQTITVSGISGADKIMVLVSQASSVNAGAEIALRLNADSGTNYFEYGITGNNPGTYNAQATVARAVASNNNFTLGKMANASSTVSGFLLLSGGNSSGLKIVNWAGAGSNSNPDATQQSIIAGGYYNSSSVISSVSIRSSDGNFDNGTIFVYTSA